MSNQLPMEVLESIIRLHQVSSKEVIRYFLTGVCLDIKDDKLRLRACNGHAMAEEFFAIPECLKTLEKQFIIEPESIAEIKLFMKGNSYYEIADLTAKSFSLNSGHKSMKALAIDGEFPDTDSIKPAYKESIKISFNPELLFKTAKALGWDKSKTITTLEIDSTNKLIAIKVTCNGNSGVLMPMRGD